jgi:ATP/ADP translocase
MSPPRKIIEWLDIRPSEVRSFALSFAGAFFLVAFMVLGRSLREAFYLASFGIKTLPYITAAAAALSIPAVGAFTRLLVLHSPQRALRELQLCLAAGLLLVSPFVSHSASAVIIFYLWTALGTLVLTSGFWIVTAEIFAIRGAKRLFGLIGAGGTAGAMLTGNSLTWFTRHGELRFLVPGLIGLLVLFTVTHSLLPKREKTAAAAAEPPGLTVPESGRLVWRESHLRTLALIVMAGTVASTLIDYQFKEHAQTVLASKEQLTGFFGAFYGWTGGIALLLQLAVTARLLAYAGTGWALAALPLVLLTGSAGLLAAPGLLLATLVRGGDYTLRKSLYRSVVEVLYVPVPSALRRRTKTFIDSLLDSAAAGLGAAIIFLWVTVADLPSRYLSILVILFAVILLALSRRMEHQYLDTVTEQLKKRKKRVEEKMGPAEVEKRDLLGTSFTRIDIHLILAGAGIASGPVDVPMPEKRPKDNEDDGVPAGPEADSVTHRLRSPDTRIVSQVLEEARQWDESHLPALTSLLARDVVGDRVVEILAGLGDRAVPFLAGLLRDEETFFIIRRRIPRVFARAGGSEADDSLLDALTTNRFEVRYRAGIALASRRKNGLPASGRPWETIVWKAIRAEVGRGRPIWELQKLLDGFQGEEDDFVVRQIDFRGQRSLEHTFRLLTLVLDREPVRAAFHGILLGDEKLKSLSLEYLEHVLPVDIREKLWLFVGDVSEEQRKKALRPLDDVVSELVTTGATLFATAREREALKKILMEKEGAD